MDPFQIRTFKSAQEAEQSINDEKKWSIVRTVTTAAGKKAMYRCNSLPSRAKKQCAAAAFLFYNSECFDVNAFVTKADHNHDQLLQGTKTRGINKATKLEILDLLEKGVKVPKIILEQLANRTATNKAIKVPDEKQLYNFLLCNKGMYLRII